MRAQLPINDRTLASFATFMLLKANFFPCNRPVWDGKPVREQISLEWKRFFKPLQIALEHKTAASSDQPDMFGTAALAQRYHVILPDLVHISQGQGGDAQDTLEQLGSHFGNLASAATNSHAALDQLAAATTEQYENIKSALENLVAAAPNKPYPIATPRNTNPLSSTKKRVMEKWILILQSAIKNK